MSTSVFTREERRLDRFGDCRSLVAVCRDVTAENNTRMGCGRVFEDCVLSMTLPYDEYLYCIEGEIQIGLDGGVVVLRPDDAIWLEKATTLTYTVQGRAVGVYAFAPVDWKGGAAPPAP